MLDRSVKRELAAIVGSEYVLDDSPGTAHPLVPRDPDVSGDARRCHFPGKCRGSPRRDESVEPTRIPVVGRGSGIDLSAGTVPVEGGLSWC